MRMTAGLMAVGMVLALMHVVRAQPAPAKAPIAVSLPRGDVAEGKATFAAMRCFTCHEVAGSGFPQPVATLPTSVPIGGKGAAPGEARLVADIITPSHAISGDPSRTMSGGVSRMGDFTYVLTVRQLVDLVAYVQSLYEPAKPKQR
jgi:mono/diheme cytochrome c family protein